ncbi:calcium/calmodulin-dependent protein kinase [Talaromyces proteolyticus]|uniref:calcium/calmodulin-dependent protein kinase n=1 Tax=Talaromyces proteolyticus TaxID=1131652 RepID=A0AAD4PWD9_9EURO|nr:calcium/calmodulin-dependent protein kinase [Talaromyces proteolyticus]KAH8692323.1 calcium/calmodulin-dependent protein kinase [Talaromyces proteolyticus]
MSFSGMLNKLQGQPESYEKKSLYRFGRTLGAGTYGIVREADSPQGKCAVKIILKKNVRGNEQMVYDELELLQKLNYPNIVHFRDWFESRDKYYIVTELATGGELFDRICEYGKFTEKDASQTIRQILGAVHYLHDRNIVHRDLKPENLLYLTSDSQSSLVLADFGIAKMLEHSSDVLTSMAGSFGYAAPEVMLKEGHGKPADMWSMGVITYTLLCGYSPFRSENLPDLIEECRGGHVQFHSRYWGGVSEDAKDFIKTLLNPDQNSRATAEEALEHRWLKGDTATDYNLLPEIKAYMARARLRRGIEIIKLANRIEALKMQEDDEDDEDESISKGDLPSNAGEAAKQAVHGNKNTNDLSSTFPSLSVTDPSGGVGDTKEGDGEGSGSLPGGTRKKRSLSRIARGAIFREVVLAKVREMKQEQETKNVEREAIARAEAGNHQ